jgi:hypothetical protein
MVIQSIPFTVNELRFGLKIGHCEEDSLHDGGDSVVIAKEREVL